MSAFQEPRKIHSYDLNVRKQISNLHTIHKFMLRNKRLTACSNECISKGRKLTAYLNEFR